MERTVAIETVIDGHARIGESPTWVPDESALYWVDIKAPALHRFHPETGERRSWRLTGDVGGFAFLQDGGVLVALRHGLHRLDRESGALNLLAAPPFDPALFRFNEGACDAAGRFWIGVMFDPLEGSSPKRKGRLHSFTLDGGLREEGDEAELHNGMAWSADASTFFLSHSNARTIFAFDYDPDGGRLSNRRVFATTPQHLGIPDGAAADVEGGYWCAMHRGGVLRRFHPDGTVDRDITVPVSQPTMPAFAGTDLSTLYLTSASDGLSAEERASQPLAGALFRLDAGVRGVPTNIVVR